MAKRKNLANRKSNKTAILAKAIALILVGICMIAVFRWDGHKWWLGELISLFGLQLSALLAVGSLLTILQRQKMLSIVLVALALFFAWPFSKSYFPEKENTNLATTSIKQADFQLLSMELGATEVPDEQRLEYIYTEDPTIIYFQNVQQKDDSWLNELKLDYPFYQSVLSGTSYGLIILSKIPLESIQEVSFGIDDQPSLVTRFTLEGQAFELIATHLLVPISPESHKKRLDQLAAILSWVNEIESGRQPIVIGPMYAGFHTSVYRDFTKASVLDTEGNIGRLLNDAALGFGWKPTWPSSTSLSRTVADHIFYDSTKLQVTNYKVGLPSISGGEHRPILASFSIE